MNMKKILSAAACAAACTLLLSACSAMVSTPFSANWLKTPSNYSADFYEELVYSVAFESTSSKDSVSEFTIDAENSSYTQTTRTLASFTVPDGSDRVEQNVYHMHSELTLSGTYYYIASDGTKEAVCSFGGENDDPDKDYDDPASVVTDVYFHSLQDGKNLQPIYSTTTAYSYSTGNGGKTVLLYNYTATIVYSENANQAKLSKTDNWGDLSDEEMEVTETLQKAPVYEESATWKDLQKDYSILDGRQLLFAARGINYSSGSSSTVNVMTESGTQKTSISCSEEPTSATYSFALDGEEKKDHSVTCASVSISLSNGTAFTGESHKMTIAQKTGEDASAFYALPVRIESPFGFGHGKMIYKLESCTHTPSAQA